MDENTRALVAAQLAAVVLAKGTGGGDKYAIKVFWEIERKLAEGPPVSAPDEPFVPIKHDNRGIV